jgi:nucleoside-diphosphate-sugar epimerase
MQNSKEKPTDSPPSGPLTLVTGATGFLGRRLLDATALTDRRVRVLVRNPNELPAGLPGNIDVVVGDVCDSATLGDCCVGVQTIIHLASYSPRLAPNRKDHDAEHCRVTVQGTENLASAARHAGVRRIVFASSVKAMGEHNEQCEDESAPARPTTAYGKAKLAAEEFLLSLPSIETTVLRLAPLYGPNSEGWITKVAGAMAHGWFPPLPRIENHRSMVHVDDAVAALLHVADHAQSAGRIYLVSDGIRYSTREIYEAICTSLGRRAPRWGTPWMLFRLAASASDAASALLGRHLPFGTDAMDTLFRSACYANDRLRNATGWQPTRTLYDALPEIIAAETSRNGN